METDRKKRQMKSKTGIDLEMKGQNLPKRLHSESPVSCQHCKETLIVMVLPITVGFSPPQTLPSILEVVSHYKKYGK